MKRSDSSQREKKSSAVGARGSARTPAQARASRRPSMLPVQSEVGPTPAHQPDGATLIAGEERRALVAQAAYFRAEHRGFAPGHELEDWVAAEREVSEFLHGSAGA